MCAVCYMLYTIISPLVSLVFGVRPCRTFLVGWLIGLLQNEDEDDDEDELWERKLGM